MCERPPIGFEIGLNLYLVGDNVRFPFTAVGLRVDLNRGKRKARIAATTTDRPKRGTKVPWWRRTASLHFWPATRAGDVSHSRAEEETMHSPVAVRTIVLTLALAAGFLTALPPSHAQTQGSDRRQDRRDDRGDARDTRQTGREDARDAKADCKAGEEKTRAECRQDKRGTKQDARDSARDIKKQ